MVAALEVLLIVLVFHLLVLTTITTPTVSAVAGAANYQHLNVREALAVTTIHPSELESYLESSKNDPAETDEWKWKLNLVHRDVISAENLAGHHRRFHDRIKRDIKRVSSLTRRLTAAGKTTKTSVNGTSGGGYEVEDFGSQVESGMDLGSGEYFVRIGVGSPPRNQYLVIDSGSDIMWVQCQPCKQCYQQSDPVFDPSYSATFSGVSCKSTVCDQLDRNSRCHAGKCRYQVSYGDGSYTRGTLALETLTFGRTVVQNVAIGCGHMNSGMFVGAAGLLGLGGGPMSFIGQLGAEIDGAFGYCLVSRGTGSYGSLVFGRGVVPKGIASWVPLLRNPQHPTYYYVGLVGLGVGGTRLPISEDLFTLSESGDGGVVMDTGTAVTRLPLSAYEMFRDYFIAGTVGLPRASEVAIFDTCYDLFGFEMVRVPTVSFYFSSGPILTLPARNFLIPVDDIGTFCFAFAPTTLGVSIIGNIQQEGIQISFDAANGLVGFGPNTC